MMFPLLLMLVTGYYVAMFIGASGPGEYFLPTWIQILIGAAATVVAAGIIWKKIIQPIAKLITLLDVVLPLLEDLAEHFKDQPNAFEILSEIVKEFRTDSGTTLRDVVNRLEVSAKTNKIASDVLAENAETQRQLAAQDRKHMAELTELVNIIGAKQHENLKTVDRIESDTKTAASDLAASQRRADQVEGEAGAAADSAARSTDKS